MANRIVFNGDRRDFSGIEENRFVGTLAPSGLTGQEEKQVKACVKKIRDALKKRPDIFKISTDANTAARERLRKRIKKGLPDNSSMSKLIGPIFSRLGKKVPCQAWYPQAMTQFLMSCNKDRSRGLENTLYGMSVSPEPEYQDIDQGEFDSPEPHYMQLDVGPWEEPLALEVNTQEAGTQKTFATAVGASKSVQEIVSEFEAKIHS